MLVNRSDPLFQILDIRRVKVEVGIPESDVNALNAIKEANIIIAHGGAGITFEVLNLHKKLISVEYCTN